MNRIKLALGMLLGVCAALTVPNLAGASSASATSAPGVDQSGWAARKKIVTLQNGLRLSYVEAGNPDGEPVLLLHGYTDSSRSWSLMVPHLSRYRLLIPDLRGHGGTEAPRCCYSLSQFADDARLFLDALNVRQASVAGHSLGSMVAITLAADHPERVSSVILIGSTALVPVKRGDWLYDNALALKAPIDPSSQFMRDWHPANQPTPVDPVFAEAVRDEFMTIPLHVWRSVMRELASVPVGRHAADVRAPVLVLSGGKDPLFPPEHHASLLKAFPQAQGQVFAELGHNPNWEQPKALAEAIDRFLSPKT